MIKKKRVLLPSLAFLVLLIIYFIWSGSRSNDASDIVVGVTRGEFIVDVNTTGELEAKSSIEIMGPTGLRNYRIYNVNIQNIIDEGTYVKKGQYVARLDPSELTTKLKDTQLEEEQQQSQYIQTQLDTTLQMRQARDELINLAYAVEEMQLKLEQSQFEPPATIKQAEIELDKARRALKQAKENYEIKEQQNVAKMQEASSKYQKVKLELAGMMELQSNFVIIAPEDGMLIYRKGWDGKAIKEGSQISAWDPVVATLPDLSSMNSVTYVNEVDIRRISIGQQVEIGLDAFPDKQLTGKVIKVANVGEQRPNSDAKVFQVTIAIDRIDQSLRPGMTTSNKIFTSVISDALSIPLEALHNYQDSITYVYLKNGLSYDKREVWIEETNANYGRVLMGLNENDKVYLSVPNGGGEAIELLAELNGKRTPQKDELTTEPKPEDRGTMRPNRKGKPGV